MATQRQEILHSYVTFGHYPDPHLSYNLHLHYNLSYSLQLHHNLSYNLHVHYMDCIVDCMI